MSDQIRIVFLGTPDFAVPSLQALAAADNVNVVAVVTQPDRKVGRKQQLTASPVKVAAKALGITVLQPVKVRVTEVLDVIAGLRPDVCITAAYGQLLPQGFLDIARVGNLNVHASLLPRWRGAAPIHRAVMAGDDYSGVTIMEMVQALDAGPIVGSKRLEIATTETMGSLHDRLAQAGADLLIELLGPYVAGDIHVTPQPESGVTYAKRIERADEWIDWNQPVNRVYDRVRGLVPWPGGATSLAGKPLKIWSLERVESLGSDDAGAPGEVRYVSEVGPCVKCADGWVALKEVQPSGKRRMDAQQWWRGQQAGEVRFEQVAPKA